MLMTEKEMVRVRVQLDDMEKEALELVDMIAESMFGVLTDHNKKIYFSTSTGEIIDSDDLLRLRGIIQGMAHCREWVLE
jgi:adenylate cyclase class IV